MFESVLGSATGFRLFLLLGNFLDCVAQSINIIYVNRLFWFHSGAQERHDLLDDHLSPPYPSGMLSGKFDHTKAL
jgi:hypothetical protein